jgi:hypothetical protein
LDAVRLAHTAACWVAGDMDGPQGHRDRCDRTRDICRLSFLVFLCWSKVFT